MRKEVLNQPYLGPDQEDLALAEYNQAAGTFGREYARGQSFWSGASPLRTLTRRLSDAALSLTEVRARISGQNQTATGPYRQTVARRAAQEWIEASDETHDVAFHATHTSDPVGAAYRALWLRSDTLRLAAAAAMGLAVQQGWADPSNRLLIDGIIITGVTGVIDTGRRIWLGLTTRHLDNLGVSHTAEVIRRRASFTEGVITGDLADHHDAPALNNVQGDQDTISMELRVRAEEQLLRQFEVDGITPPPADLTNTTWAPRLRESLRAALSEFNDLSELERARNSAKRTRLVRTLLSVVLAAGLVAGNHLRPESQTYCGIQPGSQPDAYVFGRVGTYTYSSETGVAEAAWFHRVYGRDFDSKRVDDPKRGIIGDRTLLDRLEATDPEGSRMIISELTRRFEEKNPGLQRVTRDLYERDGVVFALCDTDVDETLAQIHSTR